MTAKELESRERLLEHLTVLRCQAGDADAFARLYRKYRAGVRAYLSRFVGPDAAEDALQEVWVTVYRRIAQLTDPGRFRVWLFRIARSRAFDALRREERRQALWHAAAREASEVEKPEVETALWDLPDRGVETAMAHLSPEHREVLQLRFFQDLEYAEIAAVVGCPIGTIRSRLYHAKAAVREVLTRMNPSPQGGRQGGVP